MAAVGRVKVAFNVDISASNVITPSPLQLKWRKRSTTGRYG
jgi:hypothetical protein